MYYIPDVIANLENGGLFALVRLWADEAAYQRNDPPVINSIALPNVQSVVSRVVTNAQGWPKRKSDGKYIDPDTLVPGEPKPEWEREQYDVDVRGMLIETIERYWKGRAAKGHTWPKNHADPRIRTGASDPRNLRQSAVMALQGVGRTGLD